MPTYLYFCERPIEDGGHGEFEEYHSMSIKLETCPHCEKDGLEPSTVQRLIISGGSKGVVELTGRDLIDATKKDAERVKREVYSDANKYANVIGEDRYQQIQQRMDKQRR